jgi:hypothetical protein
MNASNATDVRVLLRADHDDALRLAARLRVADTAAERRSLLIQLEPALRAHARAEERAVYGPLGGYAPSRNGLNSALEALVEHDVLDLLLAELRHSRRAEGMEWAAAATVPAEVLAAHIDAEQRTMFAALRERFSPVELARMGARFLAAKGDLLDRDEADAGRATRERRSAFASAER